MTRDADLPRRRVRAWLRLLRVTRQTENRLREFLRTQHETNCFVSGTHTLPNTNTVPG